MKVNAAVATAVAIIGFACKNAMAPVTHTSPPPDLRCSATRVAVDSNYTGILSSLAACRTQDLLNGESTYTRFYDLSLVAGRGYLVEMQPMSGVASLLELTTPDSTSPTLLAASRDNSGRAELLFVASASGIERIRATTRSGTVADTGGFVLFARACKVPVPAVTDFAVTHTDTTTAADCQVPLSALDVGDPNVSTVHLYQVHASSDTLVRQVTFTASGPVRVFFGGPRGDTFGQAPGSMMGYLDTATTGTTFRFAPGNPGDYTLVIGGDQGVPEGVSYTLTIGAEQPAPGSPASSLQFPKRADYLQAPRTGRGALKD